ncbi:MAG: sugar:proton symporter [Brevinematales bacterium]
MRKIVLLAIFMAFCAVLISFYTLKNIQYEPAKAISASRQFLNLMKSGKLGQAYSLTATNSGASLKRFQDKVYIEWTRHGGREDFNAVLDQVFPKQSYGNRLVRYLTGRKIEPDWLYVNYHAGGIPFGIKLISDSNGNWKIVNFESHAE